MEIANCCSRPSVFSMRMLAFVLYLDTIMVDDRETFDGISEEQAIYVFKTVE